MTHSGEIGSDSAAVGIFNKATQASFRINSNDERSTLSYIMLSVERIHPLLSFKQFKIIQSDYIISLSATKRNYSGTEWRSTNKRTGTASNANTQNTVCLGTYTIRQEKFYPKLFADRKA